MATPSRHYPLPELWMELIDRKRLARLMAVQGVSPRALALAVGWQSKNSVIRLMRGTAKTVDQDKALRIAKHLGVGTDDLFLTKISSVAGDSDQQQSA